MVPKWLRSLHFVLSIAKCGSHFVIAPTVQHFLNMPPLGCCCYALNLLKIVEFLYKASSTILAMEQVTHHHLEESLFATSAIN
ncbi:hypothetical protein DM860_006596 [Cuscuta australis]|uniref:Secreted protein n=1 Tax=Cuscuta australis TaxID=267555 RepID=A0A328D4Q5_9ASTE|nr:hypothetical protein DM860_006596 [Cuscuta australis]